MSGHDRKFTEKSTTVSLGLTDGRTLLGHLKRFSPADPDLAIDVRSRDASGITRESHQRVAAEHIAYVAIHRGAGPAPSLPGESLALDIHVAGGLTFAVEAGRATLEDRLGFWAIPLSASGAFAEIYFYAHGINAREERVPLGDILLESGALGGDGLARGLEEQASGRSVNLGEILVEQKKLGAEEVEAAATQQQGNPRGQRLRLGEVLVEAGLAREEDIQAALEEQKKRRGKRIGEVLVEMGLVSEVQMAKALARKFNVPFVNLDELEVNPAAVKLVQPEIIQKYQVLPLKFDQASLTIALSDPLAFEALDLLRFALGKRIVELVATPSQIANRINAMVVVSEAAATAVDTVGEILSGIQIETLGEAAPDARDLSVARDNESGISKLVNQIIFDAHSRGASDIHLEPDGDENETAVRFRIDGVCEIYRKFQPAIRARLVSRLKIMANLDITERRKPQDGKIRLRLKDKALELRVATIPTVTRDEDVVLRILASGEPLPMAKLLLSERNARELDRIIRMPYGLILAVGPTGSGKTTTLHSMVGAINTPARKIWTAEDPVEITQKGLRQVQVQPRIGFDFAAALRAFLRADPDVIMVGEMRDSETASIGIEASLTGHLVLSTLHTNTAPETVTRLVDMGLDPFTFSDALLGVIAQRLARKLCPSCRVEYPATPLERQELAGLYGEADLDRLLDGRPLRLFRAPGCPACENRGYKGRIGVHELLVNDDPIRLGIQRKAPAEEIRRLAVAGGMRTLLQDGIEKCLAGHTDLRQILAVCSR